MTHKEYEHLHTNLCHQMIKLTKEKQSDYSGGSENPFFNVSRVEERGVITTEQGIYTRILDKLARLETFLKKGEYQVKSENIVDSAIDLANYSLMLALYLTNKDKK